MPGSARSPSPARSSATSPATRPPRSALALPRLRAAGQLPHAVRGDRLLRFLAALAHLALHVAARLPVRPARRQSRQRSPHLRQPDADDAARRPLARRELDLRRVGRPARPLSLGRALGPLTDRCRGRPGGRLEPPRARAADVLPRQHHLGVLPFRDIRRRRAGPRRHVRPRAGRRPGAADHLHDQGRRDRQRASSSSSG